MIEQLAKEVGRAIGAEWHADRRAHQTFVAVLERMLADMHAPNADVSTVKADPAAAAELIYNRYLTTTREYERRQQTDMMSPVRSQLERDDD